MRLKKVGWGSSAKAAIPTLFGLSASGIKGGTGLWTGRGATKKKGTEERRAGTGPAGTETLT